MLGAEEFGFGTTLLMCEGCVMMRVCNLDTCPMGICTQNPELRKHFRGKPEYIINYLTFVAQELREYMAKLGVRTIDELVGRTDLLHVKPSAPGSRTAKMNLDCILHNPAIANSNVHFVPADTYDFHLENTLDMKVLMKKFKLSSKTPQSVTLDVSNTDRAFGAIFGSEITRKYGDSLPDDVYTANCTGAGGQSFGAVISYLKPERDPETGRTSMVPTGEEFTYDCQLAFIAAGFVGCENYVADAFGVSLTGRGCVDTDHFRTNVEKVFACGDMRRGQSLVVWGLREGRDCAAEVDRYLMGYTNL